MSVICPCYECIHHASKSNYCHAGKINLSEAYLHTVHEGFQHVWRCRTYESNERYNEFYQQLKSILNDTEEE